MRRTFIVATLLAVLVGVVSASTGCASAPGRYFQKTRDAQPHVYRNRISNPSDCRYAERP